MPGRRSLVVIFLSASFALFPVSLFAGEIAARIVSETGRVSSGTRPLREGDAIAVGEFVETGPNASAKLLLSDGSIIDVGPGSHFGVMKNRPGIGPKSVTTQIDFGTIRASIQKKIGKRNRFLLHTPASVLAVRGTEFVVKVSLKPGGEANEGVTVADGVVDVTPNGSREIVALHQGQELVQNFRHEGQRWLASSGPVVSRVSDAEMKSVLSQATVEDHTFIQTVGFGNSANPSASAGNAAIISLGSSVSATRPPSMMPWPFSPINPGTYLPPPPNNPNNSRPPDIVNPRNVQLTVTFTPRSSG